MRMERKQTVVTIARIMLVKMRVLYRVIRKGDLNQVPLREFKQTLNVHVANEKDVLDGICQATRYAMVVDMEELYKRGDIEEDEEVVFGEVIEVTEATKLARGNYPVGDPIVVMELGKPY